MFTQADLDVASDAVEQCRKLVERQHEIVELLAGNHDFQTLAKEVLAELEATLERRRRYRDGIQTLIEAEIASSKAERHSVASN
jgi:hypothetical protein